MKMIIAFLPEYRLDRVTRALQRIDGFPGMTVTRGEGFGHEKHEGSTDAREQLTDFTPTVRVETVIPDGMVEQVMDAIVAATHTGGRGDGKLFVLPVDSGVRVRTKERGSQVV